MKRMWSRPGRNVIAHALALILVLIACQTIVPAKADDAGVHVPPFERVQLDNGAVLLLMERHDVPLIAFNAVMRGGALTDPAQQSGMSQLLVHLLEKGAGKRDAFAFADALASVGATIATDADTESTVIQGSFLARDQALMVELLADMLQRPRLDQTQFESLRARQIEFIRAAKDSDLESLTGIYGKAALFGAHPYGRSVIGSESGLAGIAHADLERHYQEQYGADRLILAVTGDFQTASMKRALTQAFNGWRKAAAALPAVTAPARQTGRRVVLIDAPDSVQSYFWAGNVGVARTSPERASLDVVNTLFGGRFTSMLNTELRIRSGLSYGARSRFERLTQPGSWQMSSYTQTDTTQQAIDLALSVLDQLHAQMLDPTALESAKTYVQGQFPLALETADEWARVLADLAFYGLDRGYIDGYGEALDKVSSDDARRVIRERFPTRDDLILVVIGKAAALRDSLRKYGPITEMKLSDPSFAAK
ncbi:MAG TPA: pitrilysin family protein [Povalibacter sp.]|nr:pitrilysin family protein [Povalibacter sp.]